MNLISLTYTSLARLDLEVPDLEQIHRTALELNALDGITGLLIFNGTHFLQIIEGAKDAIDVTISSWVLPVMPFRFRPARSFTSIVFMRASERLNPNARRNSSASPPEKPAQTIAIRSSCS